jgi:hypothetical protein
VNNKTQGEMDGSCSLDLVSAIPDSVLAVIPEFPAVMLLEIIGEEGRSCREKEAAQRLLYDTSDQAVRFWQHVESYLRAVMALPKTALSELADAGVTSDSQFWQFFVWSIINPLRRGKLEKKLIRDEQDKAKALMVRASKKANELAGICWAIFGLI